MLQVIDDQHLCDALDEPKNTPNDIVVNGQLLYFQFYLLLLVFSRIHHSPYFYQLENHPSKEKEENGLGNEADE